MNVNLQALYNALYVEYTRFQWVHFTKHETIAGNVSRPLYKSEWSLAKKVEAF